MGIINDTARPSSYE